MELYGSVINRIAEQRAGRPEPEEGMGATLTMWSDRHAYTIVKIVRYGPGAQKAGHIMEVHAQRDEAVRVDDRGVSDAQEWQFTPNLSALVEVFRCKGGRWRGHGGSLLVGQRSAYYDYTF